MTQYFVKFTDTSVAPIQIGEADVNKSLDIDLFGRIRLEYGEKLNQNLLNILENFACPADPSFGEQLHPSAPDLTQVSERQLQNPVLGQFWYNSTNQHMYVFTDTGWKPLSMVGDYAANWGQVYHGESLPLPVSSLTGGQFDLSECIWNVSPAYFNGSIDSMVCATDDSANVTMQYTLTGTGTVVNGVANYLIIGIRGNINTGSRDPIPNVSPSPSPSPTRTPIVSATPPPTPTITPTRSQPLVTQSPTATPSPTAAPSNTPAPTTTQTPAPGASITPTPTTTQTPAVTVTPTVTSTVTPQPTPTPQVSASPSPTPAVTPSVSAIPPMTVVLQQASLGGGFIEFVGFLDSWCFRSEVDDGPTSCSVFSFSPCAPGTCAPEPGGPEFGAEMYVRASGGTPPYTVRVQDVTGSTSECFFIGTSPVNSLPRPGVLETRTITVNNGLAGPYFVIGLCGDIDLIGSGSFVISVTDSSPTPQTFSTSVPFSLRRESGGIVQ